MKQGKTNICSSPRREKTLSNLMGSNWATLIRRMWHHIVSDRASHHQMTTTGPTTSAFTLLELMVVLAIITVLAALLTAALVVGKSRAKRVSCLNNLRNLALGSLMYSNEDASSSYANTMSDSDDDQNWLFPFYISTLRSFVCPNTRNTIRPTSQFFSTSCGRFLLADLAQTASSKLGAGTSYEVFGFMGAGTGATTDVEINGERVTRAGVRKNLNSVLVYSHKFQSFNLQGLTPGPSRVWLFLDADNHNEWNFPTETGNHGSAGANVTFCDGHVEWIRAQNYAYSYEVSQDENRNGP